MLGQESSGNAERLGAEDRDAHGASPQVPELLWVESVSERLIGASAPTRPWEKAYFAAGGDDEPLVPAAGAPLSAPPAAPGGDARSATSGHVPPSLIGRTAQGHPLLDLTIEEPGQIRVAISDAENELAAGQGLDLAGRALRLAMGKPQDPLSAAVLGLLAERSYDRARLQRWQTAVEVLLEQVPAAQAALLHQLLQGS